MRKYWVTLEDSDFKRLERIADEKGTSVGTISKEIILTYLKNNHGNAAAYVSDLEKLIQEMKDKMVSMTSDSEPFIVKDLIEDDAWAALTRSEKMICAKALARFVAESNEFYISGTKNSIHYYKHI